jgi:hypothetical protein
VAADILDTLKFTDDDVLANVRNALRAARDEVKRLEQMEHDIVAARRAPSQGD